MTTRVISSRGLLAGLLLITLPIGGVAVLPLAAGAATPASGTVDGSATVSWAFAPVAGASGVSNVTGPLAQQCPTMLCDNFDLTVKLPQPVTAYYQTHTAVLTIQYTWTDPAPSDMDVFAIAPDGTESGPGSPDNTTEPPVTGPNSEEDLTLPNPQDGVWHIRSVASVAAHPIAANGAAMLTFAPKPPPSLSSLLAFGPSAVVDPVFLSAEPQVNIERVIPGAAAGATDPNRIFIDWPLSTRTQTGQLHRSLDGGATFRNLLDLTCAARSRPNCVTGGGGDTVARVNLMDGNVYFSDQEALANEALTSSTDHGDSFPAQRQSAVTNQDTGVDRQWLAMADGPGFNLGGQSLLPIDGTLSYHVPGAGEYIQAISSATGQPIPQPNPQLSLVGQSGPSRIDATGGPGNGYIYQSYRGFTDSSFAVAAAPLASYQLPTAWKIGHVTKDSPLVFPWINLDSHGNLYAVWAVGGNIFYAYSLIDDPANNPTAGGTPASSWSPQYQVNPVALSGAIFPEVVAGDPGRVAIVYFATPDYQGLSSDVPINGRYNVYMTETVNGIGANPTFLTTTVNHRVAHLGDICTNGTTCLPPQDRSLADMIDIAVDQDGRPGVVYTDNNSTLGNIADGTNNRTDPFTLFAKMVRGPSLFKGRAALAVAQPTTSVPGGMAMSHPGGLATWPNKAGATNLPGADLLKASLQWTNGQLVGSLTLADASNGAMSGAITTYNGVVQSAPPAQRLQYVLRFSTASDVCYLAMDTDGTTASFYDGLLDANSKVTNGASTLAVAYRPTSSGSGEVVGNVSGNTIRIAANSPLCGVGSGSTVYSVSAFSLIGPTDATDALIVNTMRVIDATAPMDVTLGGAGPVTGPSPTPVASPSAAPAPSPTPAKAPLPNTAVRAISAGMLGLILALLLVAPVAQLRRRRGTRPPAGS